ncbi:hypothetical protein M514_05155 [Trichuris suis]|uniref:Uncharacterized protein n=1 Tax=Trichuris suis TaxID=68888 RepID=A0A085M9J2_9BILA|nr:hypothetical protein M513_05155 [Trichuris suis]KFD62753.1 hypothetical protein M514_05155 [Trichuris suis]
MVVALQETTSNRLHSSLNHKRGPLLAHTVSARSCQLDLARHVVPKLTWDAHQAIQNKRSARRLCKFRTDTWSGRGDEFFGIFLRNFIISSSEIIEVKEEPTANCRSAIDIR